jgi:hypothetical protein
MVERTFIMIMPAGLLALADVLDRDGHDVEVVHTGLAGLADNSFDLQVHLAERNPSLVGFSLQWHHQIHGVLKEAARLKKALPRTEIVLGGFTASYFAKELMDRFGFIDFIISGEGEEPLHKLTAGHAPETIPNLTYRKAGSTQSNPIKYVAGKRELDRLEFTRFDLLRNAELYSSKWQLRRGETVAEYTREKLFYLCAGRGCSVVCTFCGGSRHAHRLLAARRAPVFRSPERMLDDVIKGLEAGYQTFYICFDPPVVNKGHFIRFFNLVRKKARRVSMIFECYSLPSEEFLDSFAAAFNQEGSQVALSPDTADENKRRFQKGYWYSNAELERGLEACRRRGIRTTLYFTLFPDDTWADVRGLAVFQARLSGIYGSSIVTLPVEVEPASLWQKNPDEYGLGYGPFNLDYFISRHTKVATPPGDPLKAAGLDMPGYEEKFKYLQEAAGKRH